MKGNSQQSKADFQKKIGDGSFFGMDVDTEYDFLHSVEQELICALQKMTKKDSLTKVKALQEFCASCSEMDVDSVKPLVPFWHHIYNKISIDHDCNVREACQQAHEALVTVVGRSLAPHLRGLMGCWVAALCDVHPPVASAARQALKVAFPTPTKQADAMAYCQESVIAYIQNNLCEQTPENLSDPVATQMKDIESKYENVLASSLGALKMLLVTIPKEKQISISQPLCHILDNPKFWELAKHNTSPIQIAFYSVLSALCQVQPNLANGKAAIICPLVLQSLDPGFHPALWEAILYTVSVIEDCWVHVNPHTGILLRLSSMLEQGGSGSAATIYPNLLPLLSKLPKDISTKDPHAYEKFFDSIRAGLELQKVATKPREVNAIARSFFECATYIITKNMNTSHNLCVNLALNQIMPLVEASVTGSSKPLSNVIPPLFVDFLAHILYISKDSGDNIIFNKVWAKFVDSCMEYLQSENMQILEHLGSLLMSFSPRQVPPKSAKHKIAHLSACAQVQDLLFEISKEAHEKSQTGENTEHYLTLFAKLSKTFLQDDLIKESHETFAMIVVLPMMKEWEGKEGVEKVINHIVSLFMAVFHGMDTTQRLNLLDNTLQAITNPIVLHPLIDSVVSRVHQWPEVAQWLAGALFGDLMINWVQRLCQLVLNKECDDAKREAYRGLLRIGITRKYKNEPILGMQYIKAVTYEIQNTLLPTSTGFECSSNDKATCITFVCDFAIEFFSNFKGCHLPSTAEDLILALFAWSCHDSHDLTDKLMQKVEDSWQMGVKAAMFQKKELLHEESFLSKATVLLKNMVLHDVHNMEGVYKLVEMSVKLAKSVIQASGVGDPTSITVENLFLTQLLMPFPHDHLPEWTSVPVISRTLFLYECPNLAGVHHDTVPGCLMPTAFTSILLVAMETSKSSEVQSIDKGEAVLGSHCKELLTEEKTDELIRDIAYTYALGKALPGQQRDAVKSMELARVTQCLESNLDSLLRNIDKINAKRFIAQVLTLSRDAGHLWAHAAGLFLKHIEMQASDLSDLCGGSEKLSGVDLPCVHTLHALLPYLPKDAVAAISEAHASDIQSPPLAQSSLCESVCHLYVYNHTLEHVSPTPDTAIAVLDAVCEWRQHEKHGNVTTLPWLTTCLNVECARLMQLLVEHIPSLLDSKHFDSTLNSLASWVESINMDDIQKNESIAVQYFTRAVCDLLATVSQHFTGSQSTPITTWESLCPSIYSVVYPLYASLAMAQTSSSTSHLLYSVCAAAATTPKQQLLACQSAPGLMGDDEEDSGLFSLLNQLTGLLESSLYCVQITAFQLLDKLMPEVCAADESVGDDITPCQALMSTLDIGSQVAELVLQKTPMGECMLIEPDMDEYKFIMSYLLSWKLLLRMISTASPRLRAQHASFLKSVAAVDALLRHLFRLMSNVPEYFEDGIKKSMFEQQQQLCVRDVPSSASLHQLACGVYRQCLADIPALLRETLSNIERKTANIIDKFTTKYVSSLLISKELQNASSAALENMTVKTRLSQREIVATYKRDEFSMDLIITMPANHPLKKLSFDLKKQVKSAKKLGKAAERSHKAAERSHKAAERSHQWSLQLSHYFAQNGYGAILDGMLLWKHNVDKYLKV